MNRSERTADGIVYEVTGAGPPVLLMHAGIADRTIWDPQWERWADRYTLIRYDHRGLGESADPAEGFSIHGDALAVLGAAGVERATVIGASMGGRGAIDLAPELTGAGRRTGHRRLDPLRVAARLAVARPICRARGNL